MKENLIILAIETSTDACSVALLHNGKISAKHEVEPKGHVHTILHKVDELFADEGLSLNDCDVITFGRGPGSFTGLRIAASVTQAFAFGAELPVIPLSSLQVLAQTTFDELDCDEKYVLVAIDARKQEVYWACYHVKAGLLTPIIDEQLSRPDEVALPPGVLGNCCYVAGNAWRVYQEALQAVYQQCKKPELLIEYPEASSMLRLAKHAFLKGEAVTAEQALPIYLRDRVVDTK